MVNRVQIKNFRALKEVDVRLRPLTVLLGLNDSGKSSFLEAMHRRARRSFQALDRRVGDPDIEVQLWSSGEPLRDIPKAFAELFKLPSEGIPMQSEGVSDQAGLGAPPLKSSGENLAAFLDYLLRRDRRRFDQVQDVLRRHVPGLEHVNVTTPQPALRALELGIDGGVRIEGQQLSTGARMLFFFVGLAFHPAPPELVLIEEPENGVHPRRLKDIVELLRGMTQGALSGHATQVILSTHSPYLLDHIRLPEDQVLVFRREPDGQRTAAEVDADRLKTFLDEFMLGEVWFNQGEEGLVSTAR